MISLYLSLILANAEPSMPSAAGLIVEEAAVSSMFAVACGFVAGELGWVAAPLYPYEDYRDPHSSDSVYKYKFPAAVGSCYGLGLPFGAALGVHLAGLVRGDASPIWSKWIGAQAGALTMEGVSLLLLLADGDKSDSLQYDLYVKADTPLEQLAAVLPLVGAVTGAIAGKVVAEKLNLSATPLVPIEVGLVPFEGRPALYLGLKYNF